jgi:hypothetical protein
MPDESRVFDVSKPSKVSPPATSKPVIVGHHPLMDDPMVKDEQLESTKIPVTMAPLSASPAAEEHQAAVPSDDFSNDDHQIEPEEQGSPAVFSEPQQDDPQPFEPGHESEPESVGEGPFTAAEPVVPDEPAVPDNPLPGPPHEQPHIEGLHFSQPSRPGRAKYVLIGLLVLIIAAYLAIDSGLVNAGIKMPFHIFKQKTPAAVTNTKQPANKATVSTPAIPSGFKEYKLSGTSITFAAPLAWGDPTSATDPGYSKRGGTNQPAGTYAYIVTFATNKDIQIAVTSSKYLPAQRTSLYYDYLQWCTGTNDNQIYESVLRFTTASKVDSPSTVTCDMGPVANAAKIDSSTIVQTKAADTSGKVIGDIYTKNINDPSLAVFRVKDAAMTNGSDIKLLLGTVKVTSSSNSSSSSSPSNGGGSSTGSQ